jgi:Na+-transporting methylmalonyl-CoA/oxaloacetate decarboxylase beta subunit
MDWKKWLYSAFSEPSGNGSITRILMTAIVAFILGCGTTFLVATHYKNITMDQFNSFLGAGGLFIVTSAGPIYALNKLADAYKNKDNDKPGV